MSSVFAKGLQASVAIYVQADRKAHKPIKFDTFVKKEQYKIITLLIAHTVVHLKSFDFSSRNQSVNQF